jgi:hypothetical protein
MLEIRMKLKGWKRRRGPMKVKAGEWQLVIYAKSILEE